MVKITLLGLSILAAAHTYAAETMQADLSLIIELTLKKATPYLHYHVIGVLAVVSKDMQLLLHKTTQYRKDAIFTWMKTKPGLLDQATPLEKTVISWNKYATACAFVGQSTVTYQGERCKRNHLSLFCLQLRPSQHSWGKELVTKNDHAVGVYYEKISIHSLPDQQETEYTLVDGDRKYVYVYSYPYFDEQDTVHIQSKLKLGNEFRDDMAYTIQNNGTLLKNGVRCPWQQERLALACS